MNSSGECVSIASETAADRTVTFSFSTDFLNDEIINNGYKVINGQKSTTDD